ncbi:MAG: quinone oxidoreductase [Nitrospiraceae bacterium]|nr:quinone oxidoreductase [Nitrospiraceae bacterium]
MRAIKVSKHGDASVLAFSSVEPQPVPGDGQALVRIQAAGVNFVDIYHRRGTYPLTLPFIPGLEAAGVVEAVGSGVTMVRSGDRVAYTGHIGSYAEFTAIAADRLIRLPENISFIEGAAFPLQGMTAHYLIHEFRTPRPGDTVLIHAAAGGVGLLLVQWAKRLGARVIGTVSTPEKAAAARAAGADHVIEYTVADFAAETKRITGGRGADLILDGVAKATFPGDLECVAVRGHIVVFGSASGPADPIVPNMLGPRSFSLSGGSLGNFIATREELELRSGAVLAAVREGWLKLRVDQVFPLAEAAKAQRLLESRGSIGKIVLQVTA